jgi:dolichol-phosphate mannosyltransferase
MTMRVWVRKFRITEIPIVFYDRQQGQSKMSKKIVREAIWMVWWLRWAAMRGKL